MLGDKKVSASVAVSDLAVAKTFYSDKLGLNVVSEFDGGIAYESGGGNMVVYESETAGSSNATVANWEVDNIEEVVKELRAKGITFEHYEFPGAEIQGDVHVMGTMKAAWFKDPDGNILGMSNNQ